MTFSSAYCGLFGTQRTTLVFLCVLPLAQSSQPPLRCAGPLTALHGGTFAPPLHRATVRPTARVPFVLTANFFDENTPRGLARGTICQPRSTRAFPSTSLRRKNVSMRTGLNLVLCPHSCWNQQALSLQGLMVVDNARRYRYGQAHARKGTRLAVDRDRGRLHRRGACRWHSRGLHPHPPRRAPVQGKKSRPEMGRAAPTANSVTRLSGSADGTRGSVGTKDPRNPQSHFAM